MDSKLWKLLEAENEFDLDQVFASYESYAQIVLYMAVITKFYATEFYETFIWPQASNCALFTGAKGIPWAVMRRYPGKFSFLEEYRIPVTRIVLAFIDTAGTETNKQLAAFPYNLEPGSTVWHVGERK